MAYDAVAIPPTDHLVVTKFVSGIVALREGVWGAVKCYAKPVSQATSKRLVWEVLAQCC